jgi:hypothetical protein
MEPTMGAGSGEKPPLGPIVQIDQGRIQGAPGMLSWLHCDYGLISYTTPTFARPPKAVAP